jgi:polysaccharide deacetylase family sporulation protein PdaB
MRINITLLIIAAVFIALTVTENAAPVFFGFSSKVLPIYSVNLPETEKAVSLTFDVAYNDEQTTAILDELDAYGVKATFFLCGIWVDKYPERTKEISARGHEIGSHSYSHPDMTKISKQSIIEELSTSRTLIEKTIGKKISLFRAPFGAYSDTLIKTATEQQFFTVQWDADSIDWKGYSATNIAERVLKKTKSGSIILMHNDAKHVLGAIRLVADKLKKDGYEFRTVSDLIYKDNFTLDHTGRQFSQLK